MDRTAEASTTVITIHGQVRRLNQSLVVLATVSIQVSDPYGSSVHIAYLHSDSNGEYSDTFRLPSEHPAGNYTVYVTASKPGFQDAQAKLVFSTSVAPFSVSVIPTSLAVTRGQSASYRVVLKSVVESSVPVHIQVVGLPALISYSLSSNDESPPSNITLTLTASSGVNLGSYNFTVIGASREGESRTNTEIIVMESTTWAYYLLVVFLAVAIPAGVILYYRRRVGREACHAPPEYLEGMALSPSTLLMLPDHLRKTAIIVCQLNEANAGEVAARSGRARAAESDYLNQLARMGILNKRRKGRESYFRVK